jgi:glycogen debranching enzyme
MRSGLIAWMLCGVAAGQTSPLPGSSQQVKFFTLREDGPVIRRPVQAGKPFTVAGVQGLVAGQQEGGFEAWVLPVKLLSNFSIRAEVDGYPVPIDLKSQAAEIEVFADHTTIVYSHIAFTVRQLMFAPDETEDGMGAVVLFQIDSVRPVELTFSFTPEMKPMWPQPGQGVPSAEWVQRAGNGLYVLHTDFPNLAGAVTIPGAQPGILAPYQEKPHFYPVELKLRYEPKRDANRYFPLLMAVGMTAETAANAQLEAKVDRLGASLEKIYAGHRARYEKMLEHVTAIRTPDEDLNNSFTWAALSIEQLRAKARPTGEIGLVAGYYSSGDSARPGFGWFFGRDALYTLYAVNSFGDFALSRDELEFLIRRQRDDGKMMHEYSQTAAFVDWHSLPYMYAAADATPLFLMATLDYVQASGDRDFLNRHKDAIEKAWQFESTHDSDGDGIYDNSQGTGWVESWPPGMPHQEIYLALLDWQASSAMAKLASMMGDANTAGTASKRASVIEQRIEKEYYEPAKDSYAFSRNSDGSVDHTSTVYPMIAWWSGGQGLAHADASFGRWASHDFSTDWGLRDIAASDPLYDPISYHQGSVWPLFTGWGSLAEYRTGRVLSGYAHLMQNADQTTTQDLGAVTELLSGDYFQPFGRSTSHQLWSSAMVITPALRGLFGIDVDGLSHTIRLDSHLPADWDHATVERLHVGDSVCSLEYTRVGAKLRVRVNTISGPAVRLTGPPTAHNAADGSLEFNLPPAEVAILHELPLPGSRTAQMKILRESREERALTLELEGMAGSAATLRLRKNQPKLDIHIKGGAMVGSDTLQVKFADGEGYQRAKLILSW